MNERPGFESYASMNMYPNMPMMPFTNNMNNSCNMLESRISTLEKKVSNLETNMQKLQNNLYPQASDYQTYTDYSSYQNSMNIM